MNGAFPAPGKIRQCGSCGATVEIDGERADERLSTTCAYCGSQLVDAIRGSVAVDRVAPFRIPKSAAEDRLRSHLAGRWFVDPALRAAARSGQVRPVELRGVLVPFFAYSATVRSSYRAAIGVHWYRDEEIRRGGKTQTRQVQQTEWFALRGTAVDELEDHLMSASTGLAAIEARRLLPFDLGAARPFDARLLAGWQAELPSRSRAEVDRSARQSIHDLQRRRLERRWLPGNRRQIEHLECDISLHGVRLVLLPVWVAGVRHGDRVYRMLVHGQDGRVMGDAPLSKSRIALAAAAVLIAAGLLLWLLEGQPWTW